VGVFAVVDGASDTPSRQQPPGAISITFDNLGEAAQLELGMWPDDVAQGQHFTVTEVLPRLLGEAFVLA
jgi:hypothetical protein